MRKSTHTYLIDKIFLGVLALLLLLPGLRINHDEKSATENRMLATYPTLFNNNYTINNKFGIEYDKWFSDRFFGRNTLIKLYHSQGNSINNPKVLVEADNWLFYKGDASLRNFANLNTFSTDQLQQIQTYIANIDNWCKKHHKKFLFVIAPDKNKIYGEHITKVIKTVPDSKSRTAQLINHLDENTDAKVLYLYDALVANKSNILLYFKNDTHWNAYGAYIGYTNIMDKLDIKPITYKNLIPTKNPRGDLTNMATNIPQDNDTVYMLPDIKNTFDSNCDFALRDDIHCVNKHYTVDKSVFLLRDSFSIALGPLYANTFKTVDSRWRYDIQKSDLEHIKNNADIVILEIVERQIGALVGLQFPKD